MGLPSATSAERRRQRQRQRHRERERERERKRERERERDRSRRVSCEEAGSQQKHESTGISTLTGRLGRMGGRCRKKRGG